MKAIKTMLTILLVVAIIIAIRPEIINEEWAGEDLLGKGISKVGEKISSLIDSFEEILTEEPNQGGDEKSTPSEATQPQEETKPTKEEQPLEAAQTPNSQPEETPPQTASQETEEPKTPKDEDDEVRFYGAFELPITGATGYISTGGCLFTSAEGEVIRYMKPGESFQIVNEEKNAWWQVITNDGITGYVNNVGCMINLPDVIPSIIYYNSNSQASLFRSSGLDIPDITAEKLYDAYANNERFQAKRYNMPILYNTAKKIMRAQQLALAEGYSLKIYEAFRPYEVQLRVNNALKEMAGIVPEVAEGLEGSKSLNTDWFFEERVSDHQIGYAFDVSLVKVCGMKVYNIGEYKYRVVTNYKELDMPTEIHELSTAAEPSEAVTSSRKTTDNPNEDSISATDENARRLRKYCEEACLSQSPAEWWHFSDRVMANSISNFPGDGTYGIEENCSVAPWDPTPEEEQK